MAKKELNQANPLLKAGQWQIEDHTQGQDCSEALLFKMKDRDHEFALPYIFGTMLIRYRMTSKRVLYVKHR